MESQRHLKPLDFGAEPTTVELGPEHPAMHGITRSEVQPDGEVAAK